DEETLRARRGPDAIEASRLDLERPQPGRKASGKCRGFRGSEPAELAPALLPVADRALVDPAVGGEPRVRAFESGVALEEGAVLRLRLSGRLRAARRGHGERVDPGDALRVEAPELTDADDDVPELADVARPRQLAEHLHDALGARARDAAGREEAR